MRILLHWLLVQTAFMAVYGATLVRDSIVFDGSASSWLRDPRIIDETLPAALRFNPEVYHHYDEMTAYLRTVNAAFPQLTSLYSIGQSVQGNE